ncbi:MAG: copper-binding protein [Fischerella sp.]|uniref:cupredoxin domain-containing protein n=1 Tax=Fischerella sp. TaxID=1191 RepID=UPI0017BF14FA|nr:sulfocyanin-like copper-binding protein [Fischerella sp.]NWF60730.1 copper-binding protein [Fischerella sp.]
MNKRTFKFCLTAIVSPLFLWACSPNNTSQQVTPTSSPAAQQNSSAANKVQVTVKEMAVQLSPSTVPAGPVEFVANNQGNLDHEMVVIKTDLPLDKLPLKGDRLDEDKAGKKIGEIEEEELTSGATKTLAVNLTPGNYLIVCNLPGHFQAGMRTFLTVK